MRVLALLFALTLSAQAQWTIQTQATTADLRGIDSVGKGIAWASGTNGTVLRTEDGGYLWQRCSVPPGAEKLDFRGVQAFDENIAFVMSSGKGDLSRLYKTTDGCATWKLVFTNPDKDGFWDAIKFINSRTGFILGDPVSKPHPTSLGTERPFNGFAIYATEDSGSHFRFWAFAANNADPKQQGAFAASNSSLFIGWPFLYFGSGGTSGPRAYLLAFQQHISFPDHRIAIESGDWHSNSWPVPLAQGESAGIFSIAFLKPEKRNAEADSTADLPTLRGVAVGGDYRFPEQSQGSAAYTQDGGQHWTVSAGLPHGYRSAVAYDASSKTWITVGPNGTDISTDDGRNWRALKPGPGDTPDADKNWNALSLPFVVGPKGRIGVLNTDALKAAK